MLSIAWGNCCKDEAGKHQCQERSVNGDRGDNGAQRMTCPLSTKYQEAGSQVPLPFSYAIGLLDMSHVTGKCEFREPQTFGSGTNHVQAYVFIDI